MLLPAMLLLPLVFAMLLLSSASLGPSFCGADAVVNIPYLPVQDVQVLS
jgi:hypothetical protein